MRSQSARDDAAARAPLSACPMAITAAIIAAALAQSVQPPSPPIDCVYEPPDAPGVKYDLTPIQQLGTLPPITAKDSNIFVAVCGAPSRTCNPTTCPDCDVHDPVGVDTWTSPGQSCAAIGSRAQKQWRLQVPTKPAAGVILHYEGGDASDGGSQRRSASLVFSCNPGVELIREIEL